MRIHRQCDNPESRAVLRRGSNQSEFGQLGCPAISASIGRAVRGVAFKAFRNLVVHCNALNTRRKDRFTKSSIPFTVAASILQPLESYFISPTLNKGRLSFSTPFDPLINERICAEGRLHEAAFKPDTKTCNSIPVSETTVGFTFQSISYLRDEVLAGRAQGPPELARIAHFTITTIAEQLARRCPTHARNNSPPKFRTSAHTC